MRRLLVIQYVDVDTPRDTCHGCKCFERGGGGPPYCSVFGGPIYEMGRLAACLAAEDAARADLSEDARAAMVLRDALKRPGRPS